MCWNFGLDPHEKWHESEKVDEFEVRHYVDKTPLHLAVENWDRKSLDILLNHMKDLDDEDHNNATALESAFDEENDDFVSRLAQAGASIKRSCSEQIMPFLIEAAIKQDTDMVEALLHCPDVDVNVKWEHPNQLNLPCVSSIEFFNIIPSREHVGKTALHLAAELGDMDTVEVLVENKAYVNEDQVMNTCWTALHYAVSRDDIPMARYLLEHGADVNFISEFSGQGPPIFIARSEAMVDLMIERGADLSISEDDWSTKTGHDFVEEMRSKK